MEKYMSVIDRFMAAFKGSDLAHGQTTIGNKRRNGKTDAKSFIVKQPLTRDLIEEHLKGVKGVGAIPINDRNMCNFGVLDIDTYPVEHLDILKKCRKLKLPLIVCRSKSGGAHLFLFMKTETTASELRDYMGEMSAALGYAGCEIFPKQDQILADRGDVGNFINLPYFDAKNTVRYAIKDNGDDMTLEEFLDEVDKRRATLSTLEKIDFGTQREQYSDAPPCLQMFLTMGIPEGTRNKVMFNCGIYLKRKFPDSWKGKMEEMNQKHCLPALPASEVVTLQNQLDKKEYFYTCKDEPMASHCNKSLCKTRAFGVGASETAPQVGGMTILLSEPRLYFLDVDGKRLEITTEQLQMPIQFQRACMEQINFMPPLVKPSDWQQVVNNLYDNATKIAVSEELTSVGQFKELLETFCMSRIRAKFPEELAVGKPWTEDDTTYFTMKGLQEFLRQRGFALYNRPQIQERLKELNNNQACHGQYKVKTDEGKWTNIRVWWVPKFETSEVEIPSNKKEFDDVPF
tara:strand:- start:1433 stop:2977 length:1545 start_codon:yes stop_codon:yes gene_type:complete